MIVVCYTEIVYPFSVKQKQFISKPETVRSCYPKKQNDIYNDNDMLCNYIRIYTPLRLEIPLFTIDTYLNVLDGMYHSTFYTDGNQQHNL